MKVDRIVLDTNCLILSIPEKSPYHLIWSGFLNRKYILCVSNSIFHEYIEIIERFWGQEISDTLANVILNQDNVEFITTYFRYNLIKEDEDDNKFVDCALTANAKFIVTEDHHFNVLKNIEFPKIEIVSVDHFIQLLNEQ